MLYMSLSAGNGSRRPEGSGVRMRAFWSGERGITSIEYGLIAALIAIALMVAMIMAATSMSTSFGLLATNIDGGVL